MRIISNIVLKSNNENSVKYTTKYERRYKKLYRKSGSSLDAAVNTAIVNLCKVSNSDDLPGSYKFHKLNNYTLTVDGNRYDTVYDIHAPMNVGSHDNLVVLFTYDHDTFELILLDIGGHQQLNIEGTIEYQTPLVFM